MLHPRTFTSHLLVWLLLAVGGQSTRAPAQDAQKLIVGYLPEYAINSIDGRRFGAVTDVVFFGAQIDASGNLNTASVTAKALEVLGTFGRPPKCRRLLCVGGWGRSEGFAKAIANEQSLESLVNQINAECERNHWDGVDYDWEHPADAAQLKGYRDLIVATKAAFGNSKRIVTVAQASWQDLGREVYDAVDRIHLMSYDHDYPQATFEKTTADIDRLLAWNCPASKLVVGVPFYGRNRQRHAMTYRELIATGVVLPGVDEAGGYAINSKETLALKVDLIRRRGLAGIMIWELSQDVDVPGQHSSQSLLRAIEKATDQTK